MERSEWELILGLRGAGGILHKKEPQIVEKMRDQRDMGGISEVYGAPLQLLLPARTESAGVNALIGEHRFGEACLAGLELSLSNPIVDAVRSMFA
jgi:hypothetical protein